MLEKCLLVVGGVAIGVCIERRRWVKACGAVLKGICQVATTKKEETSTEEKPENN